jgi:hypothetical protein
MSFCEYGILPSSSEISCLQAGSDFDPDQADIAVNDGTALIKSSGQVNSVRLLSLTPALDSFLGRTVDDLAVHRHVQQASVVLAAQSLCCLWTDHSSRGKTFQFPLC